jgi:uncharacterized membrane protein
MTMSDTLQKRSNWQRVALPLSLILNFFLIAVIGGHVLHNRVNAQGAEGSLAKALATAASKLSGPDAKAFGDVMRREAPHYQDAIRNLGLARETLKDTIAAEPFDAAAARTAYGAWQQNLTTFTHDFGDTLMDGLASISPAGRHTLIEERRRVRPNLGPEGTAKPAP